MRILITGGFDPLHSGHISALEAASKIGKVYVGINSDEYLIRKKKSFLLPRSERKAVVDSIRYVYTVLDYWDDSDGSSVEAIDLFYYRAKHYKEPMAFVNGGDRIPREANEKEVQLCNQLGIMTMFGVGGEKTVSSSNFLYEYVKRLSHNC